MKLEVGRKVRLISVEEILEQEVRVGYGLYPPLKVGDIGTLITDEGPDGLAQCQFSQGYIYVNRTIVELAEGIFLTGITALETGWPVAYHCRHCRKTVIVHCPWAVKPLRGDYLLVQMCVDSCPLSVAEWPLYPCITETQTGGRKTPGPRCWNGIGHGWSRSDEATD